MTSLLERGSARRRKLDPPARPLGAFDDPSSAILAAARRSIALEQWTLGLSRGLAGGAGREMDAAAASKKRAPKPRVRKPRGAARRPARP